MADLFKTKLQKTPVKAKTKNGCDTFVSTTNPVLDLFFLIGSSRGKNIISAFEKSLNADKLMTIKMLFWARDIREGSGERQTFRTLMKHLEVNRPELALQVLRMIPVYGRWDDLLVFETKTLKKEVFKIIKENLNDPNVNGLLAKWLPTKGLLAKEIRDYLGYSPKRYRKTLVGLRNVVETQMCAKNWNEIDFNKVPSLASARYQKAFGRNASENYSKYLSALNSKDPVIRSSVKINAGAVYPHDVLKSIYRGDKQAALAQWEALPNYLGDSSILPVCDVSGSMSGARVSDSLSCLDVCLSLGLYISDKQKGGFKDVICTFSEKSKLEILEGDILSKCSQLKNAHWDMNTNIENAFKSILKFALDNSIPQEEMPKILLILSDMEFDRCSRGTAFETASKAYKMKGYTLPKVVFWNLNAREGNNPVTERTNGVALVSGFSPSLLKSILKGDLKQYTPLEIMKATLEVPRYEIFNELVK